MGLKQRFAQLFMWRGIYLFLFFFLNILMSRELEANGFGDMSFHIGIFQLMTLIFSLNGDTGIQYLALKGDTSLSELVSGIFALTIFASLVSYGAGNIFSTVNSLLHDHYSLYATACVSGIFLTGCFTLLFYAKNDHRTPNVILSLINIVLIFCLYAIEDKKMIIRIYLLSFPLQGILVAIIFCIIYRVIPFIHISLSAMRSWWKYSSVSLITNLISLLVYRVDLFFVERYCSVAELGNYIQAGKIGQMLLLLPKMITPGVISFTMKQNAAEQKLGVLVRMISFVMLIVFLCLLIFGQTLFPFLLGESFSSVWNYLLIIFPGIWALSIQTILSAYVAGQNKVRINLYGSSLALIIIMIGNIILIPLYGVVAAAIVSSVGYLVNMLFILIYIQRSTDLDPLHFLFLKKQDLYLFRSYGKR